MTKPMKIAILRARYAPGGNTPSTASCREVLMTSAAHRGLLNYWTFNSNDYFDFTGSELFPEVSITLGAADRHRESNNEITNVISRDTVAAKAIAATRSATGRSLDEFHGFYVHVFPGSPFMATDPATGSSISISIILGSGELGTRKFSTLPDNPRGAGVGFMLMAHELGHVLGFPDSFGILSSGIDWNNNGATSHLYGDPYDIMSAGTFARLDNPAGGVFYQGDPTFAGAVPADWRPGGMSPMGPAPTQASLHRVYPNAISPGVIRYFTLPFTTPVTVRLYSSQSRTGSVRLLIIHPPNEDVSGHGRCYIEFRNSIGWDQGLKTSGSSLSRRAITAHQIADEPGAGARVFYRGRLPVPAETDGDLRIAFTTISVRVLATDLELGCVDLELSQRSDHVVTIEKESDDVSVSPEGLQIEQVTPCGDIIHFGTWKTRTVASYYGLSYGFGGDSGPFDPPVTFTWMVGDQTINPAQSQVEVTVGGVKHRLGVALSPTTDRLVLTSAPGENFQVPVQLSVTDQRASATATQSFEAPGTTTGYSPHDIAVMGACEAKLRLRIRKLLEGIDLSVLMDPFPEPPPEFNARSVLEQEIAAIAGHASETVRGLAQQLRNLVGMRFR